jgi:archaetidylinositol phosphate synthase
MLKQDAGLRGFQAWVGKKFAAIPLSPNAWTMLSVVVALLGGLTIALTGNIIIGLVLFAASAAMDMIDGAVARERGEASKVGGFIDGVADRFVEAAFLFSFMFVPLPFVLIDAKIWIALAIFLGTSMPSFIRAYADHKEAITKEKALALGGICERSERLIIIIIGLCAGLLLSMSFFVYALMLVSLLSLVTIDQRLIGILSHPKV